MKKERENTLIFCIFLYGAIGLCFLIIYLQSH